MQWRSEREIDVMTALASLAGERMFFDGDHSMGVGGDMRAATGMTSQALAYYAMGDRVRLSLGHLGAVRAAPPMETGGDRALFDSAFGQSVEDKLAELYEKTWELLEEQPDRSARRSRMPSRRSRRSPATTSQAIIEGTPGPTVDGRPYHDPSFLQMLERYHDAVLRAHKEHAGVETRIPMPVPPPPVDVAASRPGNGQTAASAAPCSDRSSPPRPDDA